MCFLVNGTRTMAAVKSRKKGSFITRYKTVRLADIGYLGSANNRTKTLRSDTHPEYVWHKGFNHSNGNVTRRLKSGDYADKGIYVYKSRNDTWNDGSARRLLVRCYIDDLLAISDDGSIELYKKVFVTDKAWDDAINWNESKDKAAA